MTRETDEASESFQLRPGSTGPKGIADAFGVRTTYEGVSRIEADGGEGNDAFTIHSQVTVPVSIMGGPGNDTLSAGGGSATFLGGAGNDQLIGGAANDVLKGGAGNDALEGGAGNDRLEGGTENDRLDGGEGDDVLLGNEGEDELLGGRGDDELRGGDDNDRADGNAGGDLIFGDGGNDILSGGLGDDELHGGDGNDDLAGNEGRDEMYGDAGEDRLDGGANNDELHGGTENDQLFGGASNDILYGNDGDDLIRGNGASDNAFGGDGNDTIYADDETGGVTAVHVIDGGAGDDIVYAGIGSDTITTGDGDDRVYAISGHTQPDTGDDVITTGAGNDWVDAGGGNNTISTGSGNDTVLSGSGDDNIATGDGNDIVTAGDGDNTVDAGSGSDVVMSGVGNDIITTGTGADRVTDAGGNNQISTGSGIDTVTAGAGNDWIDAGEGNDTVNAGDGYDFVIGGLGNDVLDGEGGNDVVWGGNSELVATDFFGSEFPVMVSGPEQLPGLFENPPEFDATQSDARFFVDYSVLNVNFQIVPVGLGGMSVAGVAADGTDTIAGGSGIDWLFGGNGSDEIAGGDDGDYIDAGNDNDTVVDGGDGDDIIRGGNHDDILHGGGGVDYLLGEDGADVLFGDDAPGIDAQANPGVTGNGQRLFGGAGRDSLYAFAASADVTAESPLIGDQLFGGGGGDFLYGNIRQEILVGGDGNDTIEGDGVVGPDHLEHEAGHVDGGADIIIGGSGQDLVRGGGGDDVIWGGADGDFLEGQNGSDQVFGGGGIDFLVLDVNAAYSSQDNEQYDGHRGNEQTGLPADDNATDILLIEGTSDDDQVVLAQDESLRLLVGLADRSPDAGPLPDQTTLVPNDRQIEATWRDAIDNTPLVEQFRISGLNGNDFVSCLSASDANTQFDDPMTAGDDGTYGALDVAVLSERSADWVGVIDGGPGDDYLRGSQARDRIDGGSGSDIVFGLEGSDRLWGDAGDGFVTDHDVLYAGWGNDDLLGGVGTNQLYAWSQDPGPTDGETPSETFGVFVLAVDGDGVSDDGAVYDSPGSGSDTDPLHYAREVTGLNRMLGSERDDELYGGTVLDFMYGRGGENDLFTRDGLLFENMDGGAFEAIDDQSEKDKQESLWKEYAKSTGNLWYVAGSNANDVISVDFVTEEGLLKNHHLVTRLTENNGNFTFDAQVRLDFNATDENGDFVCDPNDVVAAVESYRNEEPDEREVDLGSPAALSKLLPPEGDFVAILIDALAGEDDITVGPTVQKTVWIDAGDDDDVVRIEPGNAILSDLADQGVRNDAAEQAFSLSGPAVLVAGSDAPTDGVLTEPAKFLLAVNDAQPQEVEVTVGMTTGMNQNMTIGHLVADLNTALTAVKLSGDVVAGASGNRLYLSARKANTTLTLTTADAEAVPGLGFVSGTSSSGASIIDGTTTFRNLTIDSPTDEDWFTFSLPADFVSGEIRVTSDSPLEVFTLELQNQVLDATASIALDAADLNTPSNDSFEHAYDLESIEALSRIVGTSLHGSTDVDWFTFHVSEATTEGSRIALQNPNGDADQLLIEMIAADGTTVLRRGIPGDAPDF